VAAADKTLRPASSSSGFRSVLITLVVVGALAGGVWMIRRSGEGTPAAANRAPATLHLDTFVLNLADPGQRSYLRVCIDLGLSRAVGTKDNAPPLGPVRDTIIGVLGQAKTDDLIAARGKEQLKQDLLRALQTRVPDLGVEEIYFTEFLIQR
jgi:flagellar basal body-associated protein FliL